MDEICGRCGGVAQGYAAVNGVRFCHPDDEDAPDCYSLQGQQDALQRLHELVEFAVLDRDPGATS